METATLPETITPASTPTAAKIDFGQGRYSAAMMELYKDLLRLTDTSPARAEVIARQFGSDFGRAMANQSLKATVGRATKDGKCTLKEATDSLKGIAVTYSLTAARLCSLANQLSKEGAREISFSLPKQILDMNLDTAG